MPLLVTACALIVTGCVAPGDGPDAVVNEEPGFQLPGVTDPWAHTVPVAPGDTIPDYPEIPAPEIGGPGAGLKLVACSRDLDFVAVANTARTPLVAGEVWLARDGERLFLLAGLELASGQVTQLRSGPAAGDDDAGFTWNSDAVWSEASEASLIMATGSDLVSAVSCTGKAE